MSKNVRRRGFTLPEVLVTITIVAVLAAVVVPAVLNQVSKGDDSAVAQDLISIRTAITTFTSDVRKYPGSVKHMAEQPTLFADSNDVDGFDYGATSAAAYRGPYLQISGASHVNPAGATFRQRLGISNGQVCLRDSVIAGPKSLVSIAQAQQMDKALDRSDGATLGSVRWTPLGTTPDSVTSSTFFACLVTK